MLTVYFNAGKIDDTVSHFSLLDIKQEQKIVNEGIKMILFDGYHHV